jgi:hypothetical protein
MFESEHGDAEKRRQSHDGLERGDRRIHERPDLKTENDGDARGTDIGSRQGRSHEGGTRGFAGHYDRRSGRRERECRSFCLLTQHGR